MPAAPLTTHCIRRAIRSIELLTDVGDIPYEHVRPILIKIQAPAQLRQIEEVSPQIEGVDGEIWMGFIKRDIQGWENKPHTPKNPASWWKVYRRLKRENDEEMKVQEEQLKAALKKRQDEKDSNQSIIIDRALDPRNGRRRNENLVRGYNGSGLGRLGKSAIDMVKKSSAQSLAIKQANKRFAAMPAHLQNMHSRVLQAPKGMVEEYKKRPPPRQEDAPSGMKMFAPRKKSVPTTKPGSSAISGVKTGVDMDVLKAREERLKALTGGSSKLQASNTATSPSSGEEALPAQKVYHAPKLGTQRPQGNSPAPTPQKRKAELSIFMQSKKRG